MRWRWAYRSPFCRSGSSRAALTIGVETFVLSAVGVELGRRFGTRFGRQAGVAGGVILVLIGTKILLEHLGVL